MDVSDNIDAAFVNKVGANGTVIAVDGTVWYYSILSYHTIIESESFIKYRPNASTRTPYGFVAYKTGYDRYDKPMIVTQTNSETTGRFSPSSLIRLIYDSYVK